MKKNNIYCGISVKFWEKIAKESNLKFTYTKTVSSIQDALKEVREGEIDILIGPISTIANRSLSVNFTRAYFLNNISLIFHKKSLDFLEVIGQFIMLILSPIYLLIVLVTILYIIFTWYASKKLIGNENISFFEVSLHTIEKSVRAGSGVKSNNIILRVIKVIWCFSLVFSATLFTSHLTSNVTLKTFSQNSDIKSLEKIKGKNIAAIKNSVSSKFANELGILKGMDSLDELMSKINNGEIHYALEDREIADNYLKTHNLENISLSNIFVMNDELAFAINKNIPQNIIDKINYQILKMQDNRTAVRICHEYITNTKFCSL